MVSAFKRLVSTIIFTIAFFQQVSAAWWDSVPCYLSLPLQIENGEIAYENGGLLLRCNKGFVLQGEAHLLCNYLSGYTVLGKCRPEKSEPLKNCSGEPKINHGYVEEGASFIGTARRVQCYYGSSTPDVRFVCKNDQKWELVDGKGCRRLTYTNCFYARYLGSLYGPYCSVTTEDEPQQKADKGKETGTTTLGPTVRRRSTPRNTVKVTIPTTRQTTPKKTTVTATKQTVRTSPKLPPATTRSIGDLIADLFKTTTKAAPKTTPTAPPRTTPTTPPKTTPAAPPKTTPTTALPTKPPTITASTSTSTTRATAKIRIGDYFAYAEDPIPSIPQNSLNIVPSAPILRIPQPNTTSSSTSPTTTTTQGQDYFDYDEEGGA